MLVKNLGFFLVVLVTPKEGCNIFSLTGASVPPTSTTQVDQQYRFTPPYSNGSYIEAHHLSHHHHHSKLSSHYAHHPSFSPYLPPPPPPTSIPNASQQTDLSKISQSLPASIPHFPMACHPPVNLTSPSTDMPPPPPPPPGFPAGGQQQLLEQQLHPSMAGAAAVTGIEAANSPSLSSSRLQMQLSNYYQVGVLLGKGGFGEVYAGTRNRDGLNVALKRLAKSKIRSFGQVSDVPLR